MRLKQSCNQNCIFFILPSILSNGENVKIIIRTRGLIDSKITGLLKIASQDPPLWAVWMKYDSDLLLNKEDRKQPGFWLVGRRVWASPSVMDTIRQPFLMCFENPHCIHLKFFVIAQKHLTREQLCVKLERLLVFV